ncbi:MAG: hypothetical protein GOVbin3695_52 [Prokaryotic dsDNA virus sp.]|nr:MAG: hypothetical protein GOVbin3695_52 [Prokaryotic dsDNA virus sp.]|tara:strand:+ start:4123 stop:4302 length:180 start_codon:yes stop_codon:yes gene_type:complete
MNIDLTKSQSKDENRKAYYTGLREQLDKLYHDIDSGKFGNDAKTGGFFLARKAVKDKYP